MIGSQRANCMHIGEFSTVFILRSQLSLRAYVVQYSVRISPRTRGGTPWQTTRWNRLSSRYSEAAVRWRQWNFASGLLHARIQARDGFLSFTLFSTSRHFNPVGAARLGVNESPMSAEPSDYCNVQNRGGCLAPDWREVPTPAFEEKDEVHWLPPRFPTLSAAIDVKSRVDRKEYKETPSRLMSNI